MTFYNKGLLINWNGGVRGNRGGGKAPLGGKVPSSGKIVF